MKTPYAARLRQKVQDWAEEDAIGDIAFASLGVKSALADLSEDDVRRALIFYARNAAARTFDALKLHGHLNITHD